MTSKLKVELVDKMGTDPCKCPLISYAKSQRQFRRQRRKINKISSRT